MSVVLALLAVLQGAPAGEAALHEALGDRVASAPVPCIRARFLGPSRIIDRTAIIYKSAGSRLWVQRPEQGAESLRSGDTIVSRSSIGSLCRTDTADLVDQGTRIRTGFVTFGVFVPYDRPRRRKP